MMAELQHRKLKSGLNICIVPYKSPFAHFQLYTPFGGEVLSYKDGTSGRVVDLQPGSAHYFEHVLFIVPPESQGRPLEWKTNTPDTMPNLRDGITLLQNNRANWVNGYTSSDITNYVFISRVNPLENLAIMLQYVFCPFLPKDRFAQEADTIIKEAAMYENMLWAKQSYVWAAQAFHKHGARFPTIGTEESIRAISLEDVLSMHATFYSPSNMTLLVTGQVDIDQLSEMVQRTLESFGKDNYVVPPEVIIQDEPRSVVVSDNFSNPLGREDVDRPKVLTGWKYMLDPTMDSDVLMRRHLAAQVIAYALFGNGSRNRERLVREGIDDRTFGSNVDDCRDHCDIQVIADVNNPERFRQLILDSASQAVERGLPSAEIDYARTLMLKDARKAREVIFDFGRQLAKSGVKIGNPADYLASLEMLIKISPAEINALAREILNPECVTSVLVVPKKEE